MTQRRATLLMLGFMVGMALALAGLQLIMGITEGLLPTMGGLIVLGGCWWAAWNGWRYAGLAAVLTLTGIATASVQTETLSPAVFLVPVMALVVTTSRWIAISTALILGGILLRSGGTGPYADPFNIMIFGICIVGMLLGRQVLDNARRTAESNAALAEQARQEAEASTREAQHQSGILAAHNEVQQRLLALVQDLEVPIITVLTGVLVVPLIGALDTRRIDLIEAAVLRAIHSQHAATVILDLTAVKLVDTAIAQRLRLLTQAIQLLGAEAVLTGLGAGLATTLVGLGITMDGIKSYGSLQTVLEDPARRGSPGRAQPSAL